MSVLFGDFPLHSPQKNRLYTDYFWYILFWNYFSNQNLYWKKNHKDKENVTRSHNTLFNSIFSKGQANYFSLRTIFPMEHSSYEKLV